MDYFNIKNNNNVIFIGDSEVDVATGKNAKIRVENGTLIIVWKQKPEQFIKALKTK